MASDDVLDFARLLAPIPGDHPTGADPRDDPSPVSDYWMIKEDRKTARQIETQTEKGETNVPTPDWKPLITKSVRLLSEKSKDMEVTACLIEGLTREKGFAGLRDGFRLARELLETYWDGLFPRESDPPDVENRFSHLLQLNGIDRPGTLVVPIRKVPFTERTSEGCFSQSHHQMALSLDKISDPKVRQKKVDDGAVTLDAIKRAVALTPPAFYADLVDDLTRSQEEFRRFCEVFSARSGLDASSSDILGGLEAYLDVVKQFAGDKIPKPEAPRAPGPAPGAEPVPVGQAEAVARAEDPSVIKSRDDALERLVKIADYFRTHEPHSIIPFALQQVVTWGKMPLPDLLAELIPEEAPRKNLFKQVGIRPVDPKK